MVNASSRAPTCTVALPGPDASTARRPASTEGSAPCSAEQARSSARPAGLQPRPSCAAAAAAASSWAELLWV